MSSQMQRQRISPSDTRRLIDDYTHYRFGRTFSADELAREAGTSKQAVENLCAQKQISPDDLRKLAMAINVSDQLLEGIAGYREIGPSTLKSLNGFFAVVRQSRTAKQPQKKSA